MKILRADIKDAEEILRLQRLAFYSEAEIYNDYNIPPLKQTLDEFKREFKDRVFLKAVLDSKIVGAVRIYEKNGTCYIERLIVSPDMQGRGIGTAILKKIDGYFKVKRLELFTGTKSEKNISLYEKLGYSIFKVEPYHHGAIEMAYMEKRFNL
ncbi:MAG: GNAT family N-acetyltransferase [Candidatus Omnitrophica bacterium]|nr:GNAT family N-acetyltransferase [Candidatus Omnitrophota bacterium]